MIDDKIEVIKYHTVINAVSPGGKGVTNTIYAGTGCAIFRVPFFAQKINFGVSFVVKSQVVINLGVTFLKNGSLEY